MKPKNTLKLLALVAAMSVGPLAVAAEKAMVYKSPTCGCCGNWVEHVRANGFVVDTRNVTDIMLVKTDNGVPIRLASCHTTLVGGYVIEGHVPAQDIKRLLRDRPAVTGLALPGMPFGSPGMGGTGRDFKVLTFTQDGSTEVYAEY